MIRFGAHKGVFWAAAALSAAALAALPTAPTRADPHRAPIRADSATPVDFGREVRPILSAKCFKCHGPDDAARQAKLRLDTFEGATAPRRARAGEPTPGAIVPGKPDASELLRRIRAHDPDDVMPPPGTTAPVTAAEARILESWIAQGAQYRPHWSFVPVRRPEVPSLPNDAPPHWLSNPIDAFVLARLESEGLAPAPAADPYTLLRRVSLDLVGLPPSLGEIDEFVRDPSDAAYERAVNRLLASPAFGEHWARLWLDMARYADTQGYEKDLRRTIWPYRDWVIAALNSAMGFDEFTLQQFAGDLLPNATDAQRLATAFHRNTMTNTEGGTDNEEFRVAAVVDRVNTTSQVWMGLTMGCAQCHTHKYDPITHEEYYRFFALLNNTADADNDDDSPLIDLPTAHQESEAKRLDRAIWQTKQEINRTLDAYPYDEAALVLPSALAGATHGAGGGEEPGSREGAAERTDFIWIDDETPRSGLERTSNPNEQRWDWVSAPEHPVRSGSRALRVAAGEGFAQAFFENSEAMNVRDGDRLVAWVFLDPSRPPREVMFQWFSASAGWQHRAFWGEDLIPFGTTATPSRLRIGDVAALLPPDGHAAWVRVEIDPAAVGITPGSQLTGWAFSLHSGAALCDAVGTSTTQPPDTRAVWLLSEWIAKQTREPDPGLPADVRDALALAAGERTADQAAAIRRHFLARVHPPSVRQVRHLRDDLKELEDERNALRAATPRVPVLQETKGDARRATHVLRGGSFLNPAQEVSPGVPAALHPWPDGAPLDRAGLARWLTHESNPLTARVQVNRVWEQLFGTGIVETSQDFGLQGSYPSHPDLLDFLADGFMHDEWSVKRLLKRIVLSATYRQASNASPPALAADPYNRLLARGPRVRLEGEVLRDQALAIAGLLSPKMGGPPVFPAQPAGIWQMIYNDDQWTESTGEDRFRRSVYTFWRRTAPHPAMTVFDAPSREFCVPRRGRTNTPLQALVTLNDPQFIEAAQGMARRLTREVLPELPGETDATREHTAARRAAFALRLATARPARQDEVAALVGLFNEQLARYRADPAAAAAMAGHTNAIASVPVPGSDATDTAEIAAWAVVCNVVLNLDEVLTKG